MNQLRSSDLFRYKQNFHQHKQKVKSIMNRSSQSIKQVSNKQRMMMSKNNLSHERALRFKLQYVENQRHINFANRNIINRIYSNEKKREKLFQRELNASRSDVLKGKVMSHLLKSPTQKMPLTSRTIGGDVQRGNSFIVKRINEVKSTISLREFNKQYSKHEERSSMISKFKVDASNFKFIPKNQITLERINRGKGGIKSERSLARRNSNMDQHGGFITERVPVTFKQVVRQKEKPRTSQTLMKLNIPARPVKPLGANVKLQQLKVNQKKPLQQPSKYSTVMKLSHPQKLNSSSLRKLRFNNF